MKLKGKGKELQSNAHKKVDWFCGSKINTTSHFLNNVQDHLPRNCRINFMHFLCVVFIF